MAQDPSKRNYKKEYAEYQGTPEQIANRSSRNKARRVMVKAGKAKKGDGKDVDHVNSNPKDNSPGNLRVTSVKFNRGWEAREGKAKPKGKK
jgi:hypothetical protein